MSRRRVLAELSPRIAGLARLAKRYDLNFTIDAEEADRWIFPRFRGALARPVARRLAGFGLAVQAYQKRALALIDQLAGLARLTKRRLMVRLVKGAYWDTEIKRARNGVSPISGFFAEAETDLNYLACVEPPRDREIIFPQFATHNARTMAAVPHLRDGRAV